MRCRVDIDGDPANWYMGHVLAEIGCIWLERSADGVMAAAPGAFAQFRAWLGGHGEPDLPPDAAGFLPGDLQQVSGFGQSGSAVGLFPWDREPATAADIATAVRRLGYARRDLLELVAELPPTALDWQPPGGKRTVRANLEHVRNAQGFYLVRLFGWNGAARILPEPWPDEHLLSLNWVIARASEALLTMPAELQAGIYGAERPAEDWTARKMLRRFVEHEREHVEVVRRTIAAWRVAPR